MELSDLRALIDGIDRDMVTLLEKRLDVSAAIGEYKKAHGLPVLDKSREAAKIASVRALCRPETADLIGGLYGPIMAASRAYETRLMEGENDGK